MLNLEDQEARGGLCPGRLQVHPSRLPHPGGDLEGGAPGGEGCGGGDGEVAGGG